MRYQEKPANEIKIEKDKAERIIAQVLRDEKKMLSSESNTLASTIATRLQTSMPMPTRPALRGDRMITMHPPGYGSDSQFLKAARTVFDADDAQARQLWDVVYSFGRDLPDDVVV